MPRCGPRILPRRIVVSAGAPNVRVVTNDQGYCNWELTNPSRVENASLAVAYRDYLKTRFSLVRRINKAPWQFAERTTGSQPQSRHESCSEQPTTLRPDTVDLIHTLTILLSHQPQRLQLGRCRPKRREHRPVVERRVS